MTRGGICFCVGRLHSTLLLTWSSRPRLGWHWRVFPTPTISAVFLEILGILGILGILTKSPGLCSPGLAPVLAYAPYSNLPTISIWRVHLHSISILWATSPHKSAHPHTLSLSSFPQVCTQLFSRGRSGPDFATTASSQTFPLMGGDHVVRGCSSIFIVSMSPKHL